MKRSFLSYHITPGSEKHRHWIFAFYGFGQQARVFESLAKLCLPRYGCVIFDLPYEKLDFVPGKDDLKIALSEFIQVHQIYSVIGISYSMGSRLNLVLAECLSPKVRKIFLIAPDGIALNFWNQVATQTILGRMLFSFLMHRPLLYNRILDALNRTKILPPKMHTFIKWHVRNKANCMMVYNCWNNMRRMKPDLKKITQEQLRSGFRIHAYFGTSDFVIGEKVRKRTRKHLPYCEIIMVEKDHNLLDDSLFDDIASYL